MGNHAYFEFEAGQERFGELRRRQFLVTRGEEEEARSERYSSADATPTWQPVCRSRCRILRWTWLKCDRVWPCTPCQRRGCSVICPDGMQELVSRTNEMGADDGGLQAH